MADKLTRPFQSFKSGVTAIPTQFLSDVLPWIDDMDELKVTLFGFYLLNQFAGDMRYIIIDDFLELSGVIEAFGAENARARVRAGLEKAAERRTFLTVDYGGRTLYFLNSPKGRAAVRRLTSGEWTPDAFLHLSRTVDLDRPNIYTLYEENIGPLTPLIADRLRAAEEKYKPNWIADAIEKAVVSNVRSWRYVEAILMSWKENGRDGTERDDR